MPTDHLTRHFDRLFADCRLIELACCYEDVWHRGGIFDDIDAFRATVSAIGDTADIYTTFNELHPLTAHNRLIKRNGLTNTDVACRKRIVFDLDPVRSNGFSKHHATNREVAAAMQVAGRLQREFVDKAGWPEPAIVASGNGAHVIFRADIEVTPESARLIDQLFIGVKQYFSTAQVDFDLKVRNPARILRLPGTWNVKKKSAPDRPSRQCRVISTPDDWTPVHTDDLAAMVKRYGLDTEHKRQKQRKRQRAVSINGAGDYKTLDIVAWFTAHAHYKFEMGGGKHSVTCPWCSEHSSEDMPDGTDSVVWEAETGWPTFHCSHDHCEGRDLSDVMRVWGDADAFCDKQFVAGSFKCST